MDFIEIEISKELENQILKLIAEKPELGYLDINKKRKNGKSVISSECCESCYKTAEEICVCRCEGRYQADMVLENETFWGI